MNGHQDRATGGGVLGASSIGGWWRHREWRMRHEPARMRADSVVSVPHPSVVIGIAPLVVASRSGAAPRANRGREGTIGTMTDKPAAATRMERDSMGEMAVPADALYGASTQRAVLNFPISGQRFPRRFIRALALIKLAAAETNGELGLLSASTARAIAAAAAAVADGDHDAQFPIDIYQTGSGTSTNTNMNEVVAHLAAARLGKGRKVHPNDDVNRCQSSNDTIPTALQLSAAMAIEEVLIPALVRLQEALAAKADEFWPIVKTGRTHLQDATPIRLGQEFQGYAGQVEEAIRRVQAARDELLTVPLGGTAVGTGINAHPEFAARACAGLTELLTLPVREAPNHFHAQSTLDVPIAAHGAIRTTALGLWKVASDVRLMGMGPRAGIAELALPETQPGSSIMPGKVNPVIIESLTMVVARVMGNDATIAFAQTGSLLELNVMLPVTAVAMLESIELLAAATNNFADRTVEGLVATDRGPALVEQGLMLATALAPVIGYDEAAKLAKEALKNGRTIRELALERGMTAEDLDRLLDPESMTEPGLEGGPAGG
jgi:fumarate hydratase class II